ncbi:MAG: ATP-binding protein [Flavobacterium johnsoniae]|nr:MAG: ATP-binding protein [Flavobacterium johnsoniae]
MAYDLVGFSRAGDVFHYRWAARRSLKMIFPNSSLDSITIEGSPEKDKAGEYVIDLTECYGKPEEEKHIKYYQLKHTTVKSDSTFVLSDLKTTFEGFSKRYTQHAEKNEIKTKNISFTIVSNRKIDENFKKGIINIANAKTTNKTFKDTLKKYTGFDNGQLKEFCSVINFEDGEGNYNVQKDELRIEMSQLVSGTFDNAYVDSVITLMQEKVLPDSNGLIVKEDILNRIGVTSEKAMFPADAVWENIDKTITRIQYKALVGNIMEANLPIIIHAEGGVGKTVFARQVLKSLDDGSIGIAYDCFGAGGYRNRSTTRHMHRTALVQIVNELAAKGLCDPLLVQNTTLDHEIMRDFLHRIGLATAALKKANQNATLVIVIDAADNAEMAAKEFNELCFAHELIRENLPLGCKIVFLCRTERINLLQPLSATEKFELQGFSAEESLENLKNYFPDAKLQDGIEFHRLTNGNPRVQANALDFKTDSVAELLTNLGPAGTNVEDQIELQLSKAITRIEDLYLPGFKDHVQSICMGLSSLSPHIPLDVLARAASVEIATVRSFVADIGRPLWISDLSVQFRDEPTETWFRKKFCASKGDFQKYITSLEPLSITSTYVSQVLPQLYLQAEEYDKLISSALSDDFLPKDNPIDARNVRVYRLQFAFKAALKLRHFKDAIKLAVRAGEEMAGEQRQLLLLRQNLDLIVPLQSEDKVKELAFKRSISGAWAGSENIYSSALLSAVDGYKGEARGFLRAAMNWLNTYFEQSKKKKDRPHFHEEKLQDGDILELANAHLNINGVEGFAKFVTGLKPYSAVYKIIKSLSSRLIDKGEFELLTKILEQLKDYPYYVVGITVELGKVGKFPNSMLLEKCLNALSAERTRIKEPTYLHNDGITSAILSFLEACLQQSLPEKKIIKSLNYYFPERANQMVYSSHFGEDRMLFLRSLAIRLHISKIGTVNFEDITPKDLINIDKKKYQQSEDLKEFNFIINGLLPLYQLRLDILMNQPPDILERVKKAILKSKQALRGRYRSRDNFSSEIATMYLSILKWSKNCSLDDLKEFFMSYIKGNGSLRINHQIELVRIAYRLPYLQTFAKESEEDAFKLIKSVSEGGPEEIADCYISLSRAVLAVSKDDASVYFENAIEIVSKFGDEISQRWEATQALAKQSVDNHKPNPNLAYRFIRVAEVVGENLREKHWDRGEAIQVCTRLSISSGIAALSRWREREIGRFERLESALIQELISSEKISIQTAIALSTFLDIDQVRNIIDKLIDRPIPLQAKNILLERLIPRIQNEGATPEYWNSLKKASDLAGTKNAELDNVVNSFGEQSDSEEKKEVTRYSAAKQDNFDWEKIFLDSDLNTDNGLSMSLAKFEIKIAERNPFIHKSEFWKNLLNRIEEGTVYNFLGNLPNVNKLSLHDVEEIFLALPSYWKSKVSFKKRLSPLLLSIGQKFAHKLVIPWQHESTIKKMALDGEQISVLQNGIYEGLAAGNEFADAEMLFGFTVISCSHLTKDEALDLLDYTLSRFELHIDEGFGDGLTNPAVDEVYDVSRSVAGFVWSSLASPKSKIRWKAAHCVRELIHFDSVEIINELFYWLERDAAGPFGVKSYPFYNFHARLYLFIALSRASIEKTSNIEKHADNIMHYALIEKHILIQKFAADTALNIARNNKAVYEIEVVNSLRNATKSRLPIKTVDYNYQTNSFFHIENEVERKEGFYFGWDFDNYWFKPLGEVFGISEQQAEDLATIVIEEKWGNIKGGYNSDPRAELWNSYNDYSTHHDHGSYPRIDRLDFYISYHSLMIVAAQLLEKMPTLVRRDWSQNDWSKWMSRHLLTSPDGRWLSDFRDPVPINSPAWVKSDYRDEKQFEIYDNEFLESLIEKRDGEIWLNVKGSWQESNSNVKGTYYVKSALVSPETSEALHNALSTCVDFRDFKLPSYKEKSMEINSMPFVLKGWIKESYISKRLDKLDPFAGEITFPPYRLGKKIIKKMNLLVSEDGKKWYDKDSGEFSLLSSLYASYNDSRDEEPMQLGNRMLASLPFLKKLCSNFKSELIIEVQLGRNFIYRSHMDDHKYRESSKIFILSADGKIRSTTGSNQLG